MKIAVRLDDITSTMDWNRFERLEGLLDRYSICPLLGVVPDNRDEKLICQQEHPDFYKKLRQWQEKGWSLAMHGWRHVYTTKNGGMFPLNRFGEFAGVEEEKQRKMIREGKEKLLSIGVKTEIFMAPGHSYDRATIRVLQQEGFRYITDGFGNYPYRFGGMIFLPIAARKNRDIGKPEGYTTLVFHTNVMEEADFEAAERIFKEHKGEFISYQEYLNVIPTDRTTVGRLKEYGMARLKRFLVKLRG